ncbi:MAG: tetratricopeptide repeat protein [Candidatus Peregrinibacteria bacterium]|nr:tetratricopeptide repeat protein [Candidatus Peregrinibacteria bacterium]
MPKKQLQKVIGLGIAGVVVFMALFLVLKGPGPGAELKRTDPTKYATAIQHFDKARELLSKDSKSQDAIIRLGTAYEELGEDDSAMDEYKKAIAIDKNTIISWTNLAAIYRKRGKYEDAKNAYMQAIELFPKDTQSYTNLADLYMNYNGGEIDKVLSILEQGIKETGDAALKGVRDELKKKWNK